MTAGDVMDERGGRPSGIYIGIYIYMYAFTCVYIDMMIAITKSKLNPSVAVQDIP